MIHATEQRTRLGRTLLLLLLLSMAGVVPVQARERIPAPEWMDRIPVADEMLINNRPSRVIYFTAERGVQDVLDFYRQRWSGPSPDHPGYKEVRVPPWTILSRLDGLRLLTVQVRGSNSSANGYLAETDLKHRQDSVVRAEIPRPAGSRILNDLSSSDPGQNGRTVLITNHRSVDSNARFYRDYYEQRGWATLADVSGDRGQTLVYAKGSRETHLVISHNFGATDVVMTIVDRE